MPEWPSNYLLGPGKCAGAIRFYFSHNAVGRRQMVMIPVAATSIIRRK
jgi:hypothetical protein